MSNTATLPRSSSREEYEDLVFREVMALYAESESRRIAEEAEILNASSKPVRKRRIASLIKKVNNKSQKHSVQPFIKRLISMAAAVVLIVTITLNTSVTPIAAMRVRAQEISDKFSEMKVKVYPGIIEYDVLNKKDVYYEEDFIGWEARYKMMYIPHGFKVRRTDTENSYHYEFIEYYDPNGEYVWLSLEQSHFIQGGGTIETSGADINTVVEINGYPALFVSRTNPGNQAVKTSTNIVWAEGDTLFWVGAFNVDPYEVLRAAESVKRIKK